MKPDAAVASSPRSNTVLNPSRLDWDFDRIHLSEFNKYCIQKYPLIPKEIFSKGKPISLEIGSGTGWFFSSLAAIEKHHLFVAIERSRMRAKRLVRRAQRLALPNFHAFRGNAIPTIVNAIPSETLDRVYLLYPCPWPRNSQRYNRWYLHPLLHHLKRVLKLGGMILWASDQKFYIDEARYICEKKYGLSMVVHGQLAPNAYNHLEHFPAGRTKFESAFLSTQHPCFELIVKKE